MVRSRKIFHLSYGIGANISGGEIKAQMPVIIMLSGALRKLNIDAGFPLEIFHKAKLSRYLIHHCVMIRGKGTMRCGFGGLKTSTRRI